MASNCRRCGSMLSESSRADETVISEGICATCLSQVSGAEAHNVLDAMDAPILLMQGNPRQVVTANAQALRLFAKQANDVAGHRGGQVFDCAHAFTAAGCGKDENCEHCAIKTAIVDTFATAMPHKAIAATLPVKKANGDGHRALQVSTEKIGDLTLVRIERYEAV